MSDPEYEIIGDAVDIVQEECAELIHALAKVKRFGWSSWHPVTKETNLSRVHSEIEDVEKAIDRLLEYIGREVIYK